MNKQPSKHTELLEELVTIIKQSKKQLAIQVNSRLTLIFWQVGKR